MPLLNIILGVHLTIALIEAMSIIIYRALFVLYGKFLKLFFRVELRGNAVTIFQGWITFNVVVFLHLNDGGKIQNKQQESGHGEDDDDLVAKNQLAGVTNVLPVEVRGFSYFFEL